VQPLPPAEYRLSEPKLRRGTSLETAAALLSASNSRELAAGAASNTSVSKGSYHRMRELIQIGSAAEHACGQPSIDRWQVLEPVSGRWSWMSVFGCCNQVVVEPHEDREPAPARVKRAA
jgi:nucleoside-specific outer membrane channel protein Tsx